MAAVNQRTGGSELMSSIAAVRQLLLQELPLTASRNQRGSTLVDELSAVQQSRYEERLKFEEERIAHQDIVDDLKRRVDQAKREADQEKAVRLSLEETNEALEKHKQELSAQLDELSSVRSKQTSFDVDEPTGRPEELEALQKEKYDIASKLAISQRELQQVKTQSSNWKQQCLASQRQVKELQLELDSFKKQFEASQKSQKDLLQKQNNQYQSFQDRLKESVAARKKAEEELKAMSNKSLALPKRKESQAQTNDDLDAKRMYEEALTLKSKAEEKVARLELEIEAMKRGKSKEEIELEQARKETVQQKVASLTASLGKMEEQADALKKQMDELPEESASKSASDKLKKFKEEYSLGIIKVGAVLESMEVQLKEKLVLAKVKVEDCNMEFKRAREELQAAKEIVTLIQSEVIDCQVKLKELTKATVDEPTTGKVPTKKASTALVPSAKSAPSDASPAQSVASPATKAPAAKKEEPPIKGNAAAKKRASTDNNETSVNKRKKAK